MRRVLYALIASAALSFGASTSASAGCYSNCDGYRDGNHSYRSDGHRADGYRRDSYSGSESRYRSGLSSYHDSYRAYRSYSGSSYRSSSYHRSYDDGRRYSRRYYSRPIYRSPTYRTVYHAKGLYDDLFNGDSHYGVSRCVSGCYSGGYSAGYSGIGYYRDRSSYGVGYGGYYSHPYLRGYSSGYGSYYRTSGYGYGGYYGYGPTACYGGGCTQTTPSYAVDSDSDGYGDGCRVIYLPYGWTWYRATNC